jgi:hypothetical protein
MSEVAHAFQRFREFADFFQRRALASQYAVGLLDCNIPRVFLILRAAYPTSGAAFSGFFFDFALRHEIAVDKRGDTLAFVSFTNQAQITQAGFDGAAARQLPIFPRKRDKREFLVRRETRYGLPNDPSGRFRAVKLMRPVERNNSMALKRVAQYFPRLVVVFADGEPPFQRRADQRCSRGPCDHAQVRTYH